MAYVSIADRDHEIEHHDPDTFITKYVWSQDHKVIAIQYGGIAIFVGVIALILSVLGVHTQDFASGDFSLSAPQALALDGGGYGGRLRCTISGNLFDLLTDDRTESLMVYQVVSGKRMELLARYDLPVLFRDARALHLNP